MYLKLYDTNFTFITRLTGYKDAKVESELSTGDKTLSFQWPQSNTQEIPQEYYIRTETDEYVVKENSADGKGYRSIVAVLNLEKLEGTIIMDYAVKDSVAGMAAAYALAGTGWLCFSYVSDDKIRNISMKKSSVYQILQKIQEAFTCEIKFDSINKLVYLKEKVGENKGVYFIDGMNLKEISDKSDTHDYATRIIPIGADGIGIEEVNDGKEYLENYQYSGKAITVLWEDSNYTDPQALMDDAKYKLNEISKPKHSFHASVIDLAKAKPGYGILSYQVGDIVTLISEKSRINERQRITKTVEYLDEPWKNTCDLSNTVLSFAEYQEKLFAAAECIENITTDNGTVKGSSIDQIDVTQIIGLDRYISSDMDDLKVSNLYVRTEFGASNAVIGQATLTEGTVTNLHVLAREDSNLSYIKELHSEKAYLDFAKIGVIECDTIAALSLLVEEIKADYASIDRLEAAEASIDTIYSNYASIEYLNANYLNSTQLNAYYASISSLESATARIDDLEATQITTAYLKANYADIRLGNIVAGSITSAMIKNGAIGTAQIADSSITDAKIVTLTANKLTAGKIDASKIEVVNLNCANLTVGTINGQQIAPGAVDTTKLETSLSSTITTASQNASSALTKAGTALTTADGKNASYYQTTTPTGTLKKNDIWFDTDDGNRMYYYNGNSWTSAQFGSASIAANAVTAEKITSGAVTAAKVASGAISTDKLAASAVTAAKIASSTITGGKIAAGTISSTNLAANCVTADKILSGAITAGKLNVSDIIANSALVTEIFASDISATGTIDGLNLTGAHIETASGSIGNFTIGSALYSNGHSAYNTAVSGVYIGSDYISLGSGGVTYFNSSGLGKIGGLTLASNAIYSNGKSSYSSSTTGFFLGSTGIGVGNGQFYVSNTGSGKIGNFTLTNTGYLYTGSKSTWNSKNAGLFLSSSYIAIGKYDAESESCPFQVSSEGFLKARSGKIGGFDIDSVSFHNGPTSFTSTTSGAYVGSDGIRFNGNASTQTTYLKIGHNGVYAIYKNGTTYHIAYINGNNIALNVGTSETSYSSKIDLVASSGNITAAGTITAADVKTSAGVALSQLPKILNWTSKITLTSSVKTGAVTVTGYKEIRLLFKMGALFYDDVVIPISELSATQKIYSKSYYYSASSNKMATCGVSKSGTNASFAAGAGTSGLPSDCTIAIYMR